MPHPKQIPSPLRYSEGLDLDAWRLSQGMTFADLARVLGLPNDALAGKYAHGVRWPNAERLEHFLAVTGGAVTILAMHKKRLAWCRAHGACRPHALAVPPATPSDPDTDDDPAPESASPQSTNPPFRMSAIA